jgi:Plasmid pRiA4b ORF-3-like protein
MQTMPTERKSSGNEIYQIKVTLLRTAPPIWRRLLVPSDITLAGLHDLLQLAMGWTDSHMHEFLFRGQHYGPTHPERGVAEAIDERKVRLNQLLARVGAKILYTYDFGDGWEHGIVFEKGFYTVWAADGGQRRGNSMRRLRPDGHLSSYRPQCLFSLIQRGEELFESGSVLDGRDE